MFFGREPKRDLIKEMFEVGAHFGYAKSRRHPSTMPYILGKKSGTEIFDLEKIAKKLEEAKEFIAKVAKEGKQLLLVAGKPEARGLIRDIAEKIEMPFVAGRWIGGTLTNFEQIRKRINRLIELTDQRDKGLLGKYTKKERLLIDREIVKLEEAFGGIVNMTKKPGAIFIVDTDKEKNARDEALKTGVPIIGLCSTDCDITTIKYPIPANDSSVKSISYFTAEIANSYKDNKDQKSAKPNPK